MTPILYSFRRCPYAIRARLGLKYAGIAYELREVVLKDKPSAMLSISPKGTVPVMQIDQSHVIDESLDVMRWALRNHGDAPELDDVLIQANDHQFKPVLDRYKYFDRFPENSQQAYFDLARPFLSSLEEALVPATENDSPYFLRSSQLSPLDLAILPFVRQFAFVDRQRFDQLELPKLIYWLKSLLGSDFFMAVMHKYPQWSENENQGRGVMIR